MLKLLGVLVIFAAGTAGALIALATLLFWRAAKRNLGLPVDASPPRHWRRVLGFRFARAPVALADVVTVSDTHAVLVWTTAEPMLTHARVGPSDGPLHTYRPPGPPSRHHGITIGNLQPSRRYRVHLGAAGNAGGPTLDLTTLREIGRIHFRFTTLTDTHFKRDAFTWPDGRLYRHGREVHERLLQGMLRHAPAFILHKGDCSEPPGARRLMRYGDAMRRSPVPIHYIPGNHDYYRHRDFMRDWELMTGTRATYHSFTHENVHFVLMDTCWTGEQERGFFGARQLAWLQRDLHAHESLRTLIITHHPIFGRPEENRVCHDSADFCAVAAQFPNVCAVLSGHVHRNLVRWSDALPGVPNVETASGIQYPIGYALYEVGESGLRQISYVIDDFALSAESWSKSWLRSVTNPSEPMGRVEDRNFVLAWPESRRTAR